jgi:hypothetical protein
MKAEIYRACDVPAWRKQIIYSADKRDEKTSEAARQDVDESCREEAYQRSTRLNGAVLDAVLSGSDKAALRGLADNRVLPVPARLDIHRRARVRLRELGEPT